MKRRKILAQVLAVAVLFGLLFWVIDGLVSYYFFRQNLRFMILEVPDTLLEALLLQIAPYTLFVRIAFLITCIIGGILTASYIIRQRELETRYRILFDNAPVGIGISTPAGKIVQYNEATEKMFRYKKGELQSVRIQEFYAEAEGRQALLQELQKRGSVYNYPVKLKYKDGSPFDAVLTIAPITLYGQQLYLTVMQDVTERRRMEEVLAAERASLAQRVAERTAELRAANLELERAARLKDEFLANMSHELRTPLTLILTLTEMLKGSFYGPVNEKQRESLEGIEESGHHLLKLINDVLDLSKMSAGQLTLELGPLDVREICKASLKFVEQEALKKQLRLTLNVDKAVGLIQADERRVKQILVNLLSNAVKFTPPGGTVRLEVGGNADKQRLHFTVRDTGIGIALEDMEELFQPFVQLDSSLTREYEGTGLGLALAQRLVQMHNGEIQVQSRVGEGSAFTVTLPWRSVEQVIQPSEQQLVAAPSPAPLSSAARILLVEDNLESLAAMSDYLTKQGYEILQAQNGLEALERARTTYPDLVVMDIQMPVMDGLETTRRMRADIKIQDTPIIALTARAMPGDEELCLAAGANLYVSKPVSLKDLAGTIARTLG